MVWDVRFELTALGSQGRCSTVELIPEMKCGQQFWETLPARALEVWPWLWAEYVIERQPATLLVKKVASVVRRWRRNRFAFAAAIMCQVMKGSPLPPINLRGVFGF